MTNHKTKLKYFDKVLYNLETLANKIDEECPQECRTDALSEIIWDSYDLVKEVTIDNRLENQDDEHGNTTVAL